MNSEEVSEKGYSHSPQAQALMLCLLVFLLPAITTGALAETEESAATQSRNPVPNLIRLRLQNISAFGIGPNDRVQNILNTQLVYPVNFTPSLNLITRTALGLVSEPDVASKSGSTSGLGDLRTTLYLAPAPSNGFLWGLGAVLIFPTATSSVLGTGKWIAGPSVAAIDFFPQWVVSLELNNLWSYAGDSDRRDYSVFQIVPGATRLFPPANSWYLFTQPNIVADWNAPAGNRWIVPLGGGIGGALTTDGFNLDMSLQSYWRLEKPEQAGDWTLNATIQVLLLKTGTQ